MRGIVLAVFVGVAGCDQVFGVDGEGDRDGDGVPNSIDRCDGFDDHLDEDLDGAPDDCDNCPNVENPEQDNADAASGDLVGDACDPDTRLGTQCVHRVALFDGFVRDTIGPWVPASGTWRIADGALQQSSMEEAVIHLPGSTFVDVTVIVTARLTSAPSTTSSGSRVAIGIADSVTGPGYRAYVCAFGSDDTGAYAALWGHFTDGFENPLGRQPASASLVDGGSVVLLQDDHPFDLNRRCVLRQLAPTASVGQAANSDATWAGGTLVLETREQTVNFESVAVIIRGQDCL